MHVPAKAVASALRIAGSISLSSTAMKRLMLAGDTASRSCPPALHLVHQCKAAAGCSAQACFVTRHSPLAKGLPAGNSTSA